VHDVCCMVMYGGTMQKGIRGEGRGAVSCVHLSLEANGHRSEVERSYTYTHTTPASEE